MRIKEIELVNMSYATLWKIWYSANECKAYKLATVKQH